MNKKILIATPFYLPGFKAGGPIRSISNLVNTLGNQHDFFILTGDRDLKDETPYHGVKLNRWIKTGRISVYHIGVGLMNKLRGLLCVSKFDVIYLNSFFAPVYSIAPLFLSLMWKKKVVIAPRGEFSTGALSIKAGKKSNYIRLFRKLNVHKKVIWHATNKAESMEIYAVWGSDIKVLVAPNLSSKGLEFEMLRKLNAKKTNISDGLKLLFISRVSKIKNLDFALQQLKKVNHPVSFSVYGPMEDKAYFEKCVKISDSLPSHIKVAYMGELPHQDTAQVFQENHFFFLPTKGENYGHVIAEALQNGCPVLLSDRHPWEGLEAAMAGWSLPLEVPEKFCETLQKIGQLDQKSYLSYSEGALKYWQYRNLTDNQGAQVQYQSLFNL